VTGCVHARSPPENISLFPPKSLAVEDAPATEIQMRRRATRENGIKGLPCAPPATLVCPHSPSWPERRRGRSGSGGDPVQGRTKGRPRSHTSRLPPSQAHSQGASTSRQNPALTPRALTSSRQLVPLQRPLPFRRRHRRGARRGGERGRSGGKPRPPYAHPFLHPAAAPPFLRFCEGLPRFLCVLVVVYFSAEFFLLLRQRVGGDSTWR